MREHLRDYDGNMQDVPNGAITTVTTRSRSFSCAVIDVGVARSAPLLRLRTDTPDGDHRSPAQPALHAAW